MNIFFDVDYTILSMDGSLRPDTVRVFEQLIKDGHTIYIWSGQGLRWTEVKEHKLTDFVADCFVKPLHQYSKSFADTDPKVWPDLVVDDYPEVASAFGGIWVKPYFFRNDTDKEMLLILKLIRDFYQTGSCDHKQFLQLGDSPYRRL